MENTFKAKTILEAEVQAYLPPIVRAPDGFRGGLVLRDHSDAPLRQTRWRQPVDSFRDGIKYSQRLAGEYVFAGPIYHHFGHFMAEMIHRVLPALEIGLKHPLLFVSTEQDNRFKSAENLPAFVKSAVDLLGADVESIQIVDQHSIIETLHVVEPGSDLGGGPKPYYLDMLKKNVGPKLDLRFRGVDRPKKIYVSRSGLPPESIILGEAYFESQILSEGFTIFRPEEFTLEEQMDYYRQAECVIFPEGSACHGTELLGRGMMNSTYLIPRREGQSALFRKVLEPRSGSFKSFDDCIRYLGTGSVHPRTGTPLPHLGVSLLRTREIKQRFGEFNLARLQNLSESDYASHAKEDFRRYLEYGSQRNSMWNAGKACELADSVAEQINI